MKQEGRRRRAEDRVDRIEQNRTDMTSQVNPKQDKTEKGNAGHYRMKGSKMKGSKIRVRAVSQ
jgi:hypothetical protein